MTYRLRVRAGKAVTNLALRQAVYIALLGCDFSRDLAPGWTFYGRSFFGAGKLSTPQEQFYIISSCTYTIGFMLLRGFVMDSALFEVYNKMLLLFVLFNFHYFCIYRWNDYIFLFVKKVQQKKYCRTVHQNLIILSKSSPSLTFTFICAFNSKADLGF